MRSLHVNGKILFKQNATLVNFGKGVPLRKLVYLNQVTVG